MLEGRQVLGKCELWKIYKNVSENLNRFVGSTQVSHHLCSIWAAGRGWIPREVMPQQCSEGSRRTF